MTNRPMAAAASDAPVLSLENLSVRFATSDGDVQAVRDVSLGVRGGECLGIVGESGSGKSQTFLATLGLLAQNGRAEGKATFRGQDILGLDAAGLNKMRGNRIAVVFQDPMTSLTPHMRIGRQLAEVLILHKGLTRADARARALDVLGRVGIADAGRRIDQFPHELSGGMRQRVMIAMALLCEPELLIADEPTTALDVTVQAQILDILRHLTHEMNLALVLITHDLGVVAGLADRVAVMYGGRVVEQGTAHDIFHRPGHPYTRALLKATTRLDDDADIPLAAIPGQPPSASSLPTGCAFAPRCDAVFERCHSERPALATIGPMHRAACHLVEQPQ
jgi:oligopeptide transport system ATP-binding protein